VQVHAAVAHVGRDQVGILDVEHAAVGTAPDHSLGDSQAGVDMGLGQGCQQMALGIDDVEVVDRGHDVAGDLDSTAPVLGDAFRHFGGVRHHVVGLVAVEAPGSHVDDGLGGPSLDVGDVEEGTGGIIDAGFGQTPVVGHLHGEFHGRVVTGLEFVRVLAGVGVASLKDHLEDAAVEAAHVDGTETTAVDRQEHVPVVDDVFVQVAEAELADLLVDADPDGHRAVDGVVVEHLVQSRHDDSQASFVVAAQEGGAVGAEDAGAFEALEVGGRDDHVAFGQLDVAALVVVDHRVVDLAGHTGVGVDVRRQADVGSLVQAERGRDIDQEGLVRQDHDPVVVDSQGLHLVHDLAQEDLLALTAGMSRLFVGLAFDRGCVVADVLHQPSGHVGKLLRLGHHCASLFRVRNLK